METSLGRYFTRDALHLVFELLACSIVLMVGSVSGAAEQPSPVESRGNTAKSSAIDADRQAAEWGLAAGGSVRVLSEGALLGPIAEQAKLPAGAFTLQEIDLQECNVSDEDLHRFSKLSGLKKLVLARTKVTDAGLIHINSVPSLDVLDLSQLAITDAGVAHLAGLSKLRLLDLAGTDIGDVALEQLRERHTLRSLALGGTVVTDLGMMQLARLKGLRTLLLDETFVSDVGLAQLRALPDLTSLNVKSTVTTRQARAAFSTAIRGCKVQSSPGENAAAGHGSPLGRRVLALKEPRALKLEAGLLKTECATANDDSSGEAGFVDPDTLIARPGTSSMIESITPWEHDPKKHALSVGYLKIETAGEYAFAAAGADNRHAFWVGTAMISGDDDRQDSSPVRLQLDQGYVPIISAAYAGSAPSVLVRWRPPGQAELSAIDRKLLFHEVEPTGRKPHLAIKPLKARPLSPGVTAPGTVTVSGARDFTPVKVESFCQKPLPGFLAGATLFAPRYKPTDSNVRFGRVDVAVHEDTALFIAVIFEPRGSDYSVESAAERRQHQLARDGWTYAGELNFQDPLFETHDLYWRACKKGEKLALRTCRLRPPLVIVPSDPGIRPLDNLPTADMPDRIAEDILRSKATTLLRTSRFDELEALAQRLRVTKPRLKSGHSIQSQFYRGLLPNANTDRQWVEELALYESWLAAEPESVAAHTAMGEYWREYAWKARGTDYAAAVKPDDLKLYHERIQKAREWSEKAHQLEEKDVYLCEFNMQLAVDLGYSIEQVAEIIDEALEIDPVSKGAIYEAGRYFLPRWHGQPGQLEEFALAVSERTQQQWGDSVYFGLVWDARMHHGSWVFHDFKFDWERVKRGFADYQKLYPAATLEKEQFAELACYKGDRRTAREALAQFEMPTAKFWTGDEVEQLRRWSQDDYLSGEQAAVFEATRSAQLWLDWFAEGTRWAVFDNDDHLVIWDAKAGALLRQFEVESQVWTAALDSTENAIIAAEFSGKIRKFDLDNGEVTEVGEHDRILGATASPDRTEFVTTGRDMTIKFWDVEQAVLADTWETNPATMEALALSPDGKTLVTGSFNRRVTFWDRATKTKQADLPPFSTGIKFVRISNDGKLLAVLDSDELSLWQLPKREKLGGLDAPKLRVHDLVFSADGRYLAAATGGLMPGAQGFVIIWDVASRKRLHTFHGHKGIVGCVRFSPDCKHVASCSDDMTIRLWELSP